MLSTLLTRLHLRGLVSLLAVLALVATTSAGALAQDATPEASPVAAGDGPGLGDAVVLFDERGDELAQVAVLEVTDPFEDTSSGAQRGYHYVAIEVVVENLTDDVYELNTFDIRLVDGEGTLYSNTFVSRSEESRAEIAELESTELEAGAAASGLLIYEIVDGAAPAMVANTNGYESFTLLADLREAVPAEGEPTTLYDDRGDEVGSITVDETLPALEDESDAFDADRGETIVGVNITVENTGDSDLEVDPYAMYVVDEFGYLYNTSSFFRPEDETADLPDFPTDPIAAGESASGLVAFTLPTEVQVSYILYVPGGQQLFVVAQLGDGPVVSGDTLTPVPVPAEDDGTDEPIDSDETPEADETPVEVSAECAELSDWAEGTTENLAVFEESEILQAESPADLTPSDLRDAAVEIREAAEAQGELDVPELAGDANDAVVTFLETFAEVLEEGADEVEGGADPEEVFSDDLFAEDSDLGVAITELVEAQVELSTVCPDLDLGF
jgi:hypothetical protein